MHLCVTECALCPQCWVEHYRICDWTHQLAILYLLLPPTTRQWNLLSKFLLLHSFELICKSLQYLKQNYTFSIRNTLEFVINVALLPIFQKIQCMQRYWTEHRESGGGSGEQRSRAANTTFCKGESEKGQWVPLLRLKGGEWRLLYVQKV